MPNPVPEEVGKLPEEIQPNASTTKEELGLSGSAESHDLQVDFGPAIDDMFSKNAGKDRDNESEKTEENKEADDDKVQESTDGEKTEAAPAVEADAGEEKPKPEADEPKKVADQKAVERDSDLKKFESGIDPHIKPKTRKIIDNMKAEATKARDRAEAAEKSRSELEAKVSDLEKRVSSTKLPEETEKELSTLRDKVRELNINQDPIIVAKYDKKIEANTATVLETLKKAGLPDATVASIKKSGVTLNSVKAYIDMLETGKGADGKQYEADPETAEQLRETLRENGRLSRGKEQEIADWRSNWDARQKDRGVEQQKYYEEANQRQTKAILEHTAKFDFLKPPPEPLDSDLPVIKKEKEKSRVAFNGLVNQFSQAIKKETADPVSQLIAAKVGILYRDLVTPRLQARATELEAQVKELQARIDANKKAGGVSKTVSATPALAKAKPYEPKDYSNEDSPFDGIIDSLVADASSKKDSE